jgi:hypothetical protein
MGAVLVCAMVAASCGFGGSRPPGADRPQRLDGQWSLEFRLGTAVRLGTDAARVLPVRGEAFLIENGVRDHVTGLRGAPTHYGTYAADFGAFEIEHPPRGRVPGLAVRLAGGDSVEAVLDPGSLDEFRLAGRLAGDSVVGEWRYDAGRRVGAGGPFVMRRGIHDDDPSRPRPRSDFTERMR